MGQNTDLIAVKTLSQRNIFSYKLLTSGHTSFNIRKFGPSPCAVKFHSVAQIVKYIHQSEFPKKIIGEHQRNIIRQLYRLGKVG